MWRARWKKCSPIPRRRIQEVDCGVNHGRAAIYQVVARRMLSYLDKSEVLKVNAREFESYVLAPNEPNIDIEYIVMQARGNC